MWFWVACLLHSIDVAGKGFCIMGREGSECWRTARRRRCRQSELDVRRRVERAVVRRRRRRRMVLAWRDR